MKIKRPRVRSKQLVASTDFRLNYIVKQLYKNNQIKSITMELL